MDLHSSSAAIGTGTMLLSFSRSSKFATGSSTYSNRSSSNFLALSRKVTAYCKDQLPLGSNRTFSSSRTISESNCSLS